MRQTQAMGCQALPAAKFAAFASPQINSDMPDGAPKRWVGGQSFQQIPPLPPQNSRCSVANVDNQALNPLQDPLQSVAQSRCNAKVAKLGRLQSGGFTLFHFAKTPF
jgi:hypothetical protein